MNQSSKDLVEKMHDLAERSLPPELYEMWDKIKFHYDGRPVSVLDVCGEKTIVLECGCCGGELYCDYCSSLAVAKKL